MNKYEVYLSKDKTITIEADNFTVYKDEKIVKFIDEHHNRNIAFFSLYTILGFRKIT